MSVNKSTKVREISTSRGQENLLCSSITGIVLLSTSTEIVHAIIVARSMLLFDSLTVRYSSNNSIICLTVPEFVYLYGPVYYKKFKCNCKKTYTETERTELAHRTLIQIHFPDVFIIYLQSVARSLQLNSYRSLSLANHRSSVMEYRFSVFGRSIFLSRHDELLANDSTGSPNNIPAIAKSSSHAISSKSQGIL